MIIIKIFPILGKLSKTSKKDLTDKEIFLPLRSQYWDKTLKIICNG